MSRYRFAILCAVSLSFGAFSPLVAIAQQQDNAVPSGTIGIVQSVLEGNVMGLITVTYPDQTTLEIQRESHDITEAVPGRYTLSIEPPTSADTHIELTRNGVTEQPIDRPQITFILEDGDDVSVAIRYSFSRLGTLSVTSQPSGVPFTIEGPNRWTADGVTPSTYERAISGQYIVHYHAIPDCLPRTRKAGLLQKSSRLQFDLEIDCDDFAEKLAQSLDEGNPAPDDPPNPTDVDRLPSVGEPAPFIDVPPEAWFNDYVRDVVAAGMMTGYRDTSGQLTGRYGPGDPLTLAELATVAHGVAELPPAPGLPQNANALGQWFEAVVASAEIRGWLVYQDPLMDLHRPASRGEVVATLLQALRIPRQWASGAVFADVQVHTPYAHSIETAAELRIVSGRTGPDGQLTGTFDPAAPVSRAELAKIVWLALDRAGRPIGD